jgi:RNA polymerase sigma-70 factor (ECF subfamily)
MARAVGWGFQELARVTRSDDARDAEQARTSVRIHEPAIGASEAAEVRAARAGDGDAYARIIARHQAALAQRMRRFARDAATVEELVHDVFVEAYFSLGSYRGEAPLEHWLQRIATRVGYRAWQRQRRQPTMELPAHVSDPNAAAGVAARDAADEAALLLERLPPRDRLVLTLLYVESRNVAEAAEMAGWSQTMVKVQASRARKKLRKLMDESERGARPRSADDGRA